jgi:hypothetical protein
MLRAMAAAEGYTGQCINFLERTTMTQVATKPGISTDSARDSLCSLVKRHNISQHLTSDQDTYLRGEGFQSHLERVWEEPRRRALLACAMLEHFALDPRESGADFMSFTSGDELSVNLQMHEMVSLTGAFLLPVDAPETLQLVGAMAANRRSPLFKAAQLDLKLRRINRLRSEAADALAAEVSRAEYDKSRELYTRRELEDSPNLETNLQIIRIRRRAELVSVNMALFRERRRQVSEATVSLKLRHCVSFYDRQAVFAAEYVPKVAATELSVW